jgi:hypothetical protein
MIETLKNIGRTVRHDPWGRIKNNPLLVTVENRDKKKKSSICYHIDIDTVNKTLHYKGMVDADSITLLRYDTGGNTFPYLIGPIREMKKLNHYSMCLDNHTSLRVQNKLMLDYAGVIDAKRGELDAYMKGKEVDAIIDFTVNGKPFHDVVEIMDEIDRVFIENITESVPNTEYRLLTNVLLGFFKTSWKEGYAQTAGFDKWSSYKSMPLHVEDINDLLYSKSFHQHIGGGNLVGDFYITYLPNIKNLPYSLLERILEEVKSQPYDAVATKAQKIKDTRRQAPQPEEEEIDFSDPVVARAKFMERFIRKSKAPINKPDINFDIILKLKGGNTVMDVNILSSVNITKIEQVDERIKEAQRTVSSDKRRYTTSLTSAFYWLFRHPSTKDTKAYNSLILKWIFEIFNESYFRNPLLDTVFIERVEYMLRNTAVEGQKSAYESLRNHYKFLKHMQQNGKKQHEDITGSRSYQIGVDMGNYCKVWQDDRKNLESYIRTLNGKLSQSIKSLGDVRDLFNEFTRRLYLNNCYIWEPVSLEMPEGETFNPKNFIYGYYEAQLSYTPVEKKKVGKNGDNDHSGTVE